MAVAATFLLWVMPQTGRGQAPVAPVIDTSAQVEASQCVSCHATLGSTKRPGLIFNHGNHLVVSCYGCHYEMPHQEGVTQYVPMEVCFTCHGVQHGPAGRARHEPVPEMPHAVVRTQAAQPRQGLGEEAPRRLRQEERRQRLHDVPQGGQGLRRVPREAVRQRGPDAGRVPVGHLAAAKAADRSRSIPTSRRRWPSARIAILISTASAAS